MSTRAQALATQFEDLNNRLVAVVEHCTAADQHAHCTKAETLDVLRRNGAAAARFIAELSDEQLDHTAFFPLMAETRSTQRMIERILLGHPQEHLSSIRAGVTTPVRR